MLGAAVRADTGEIVSILDSDLPPEPPRRRDDDSSRILPAAATNFLRQKPRKARSVRGLRREWEVIAGVGYRLTIPDIALRFDLSRVRSKWDETIGLLTVRAQFAGALTVGDDNVLSSADFNLSSLKTRQERARHLDERARAPEIDWLGLVEEFCHRVLAEVERGAPVVQLQRVEVADTLETEFDIANLPLLRRLPTIWFGDGGCGKSYLSLYAAIGLAQSGRNVLYCDWEFAQEDHAMRLRSICGSVPDVPNLFYRRCQRPLDQDVTFLKQAIHQHRIEFLICDSIGFACGGAPEDSDSALRYFSAVRELGSIGSLHIAHINKSEQGDQKPFGSVFWANGARSIWYVKRSDVEAEGADFTVAMMHRKANTGKLQRARAMRLQFVEREVRIFPTEITNHAELSDKLPLWQRIAGTLKQGAMSSALLASELGEKEETVRRTLNRYKKAFVLVSNGSGVNQYGLVHND